MFRLAAHVQLKIVKVNMRHGIVFRSLSPNLRYLSSDAKKMLPLRNQDIPGDKMRVIYMDTSTNKKEWRILSRKDALSFAKQRSLDLVAMNLEADPPICKLDDYGRVLADLRQKEKAKRANQRASSLKEVVITLGIDTHDFATKVKKVKSFLADAHPVKLTLMPRRRKALTKSQWLLKQKTGIAPVVSVTPFSDLDETTLHVLTETESDSVTIQQKDIYREIPVGLNTGKGKGGKGSRKPSNKLVHTPKTKKAAAEKEKKAGEAEEEDEDQDEDDEELLEQEAAAIAAAAGDSAMPQFIRIFAKREFMINPKSNKIKNSSKVDKKA
jgi:translation initiation factor IF-3